MKKRFSKWFWIILVTIIMIIIIGIILFFVLKQSNFNFGGVGFDFSSGVNTLNKIGDATNKNNFESAKLNPFSNSTG